MKNTWGKGKGRSGKSGRSGRSGRSGKSGRCEKMLCIVEGLREPGKVEGSCGAWKKRKDY